MYRPVKFSGDTVEVPQLLFSRLGSVGDDGRFKVALYLLGGGEGEVLKMARALRMTRDKVEAALHYWEGAGLIEQDTPLPAATSMAAPAAPRKHMTTRQSVQASEKDPTLGHLLGELQRLFGAVVSQTDTNIYITLYSQDGFAADLILMAASEAAARGVYSAKYVEKMLFGWRREGIDNCRAADAHLKLAAERGAREAALAKKWGLGADPFTLVEKKKIAQWYEEYGYSDEMIEAARMSAGERGNDVKYLAGILKKWNAKGYRTPREVQQAEGGANLRVTGGGAALTGEDLLAAAADYVPMKRRKSE